jgi:hypothetical protein
MVFGLALARNVKCNQFCEIALDNDDVRQLECPLDGKGEN